MYIFLHITTNRPSNRFLRRDRCNKKIEKFYVVIEEGDEEISDLEEVERYEDNQATPLLHLVFSTVPLGLSTHCCLNRIAQVGSQ